MILSSKTLEKLRLLINEETEYRSGPKLIQFFNALGFNDVYGQGFPSRWVYTDDRLSQINGTPELDKCIRSAFAPVNFIGRFEELDAFIDDFNQFIAFDKWKVVRDEAEIQFHKLDKIEIKLSADNTDEDSFLKHEFNNLDLNSIGLEHVVTEVLQYRIDEMEKCFSSDAPLSVIFLAGSTLEGILLGLAKSFPKQFNMSPSSPKKEGKVKPFHEWTLSNLIDVAKDIGLIQQDVKKFSHSLRDFRNYIHPFEQLSSGFNPSMHTAKISLQVLKTAIYQIIENISRINT